MSNEKKVTLLQSVMRAKAYNVLDSLTVGIKSADKTFAEIVESLQNYLSGICWVYLLLWRGSKEKMRQFLNLSVQKGFKWCVKETGWSIICRNETVWKWLLTGLIDPGQDIESGGAVGGTKMLWATCVSKAENPNQTSKAACLPLCKWVLIWNS